MTVAANVKQTLASLKGAQATLLQYAKTSQEDSVKIVCKRNADRMGKVIDDLEKRVQTLEFEEPQYKGY